LQSKWLEGPRSGLQGESPWQSTACFKSQIPKGFAEGPRSGLQGESPWQSTACFKSQIPKGFAEGPRSGLQGESPWQSTACFKSQIPKGFAEGLSLELLGNIQIVHQYTDVDKVIGVLFFFLRFNQAGAYKCL